MAWPSTSSIGSGQDYETIILWEADGDDEVPTDGTNYTGEVYGTPADASTIYFNNWNAAVDPDTRIVLQASSGNECDGVNNAAGTDALVTQNMELSVEYMDIISIEFTGQIKVACDAGGEVVIAKCYFRETGDSAIFCNGQDSAFTTYIGGCVFKNVSNGSQYKYGVYNYDTDSTVYACNCTFADIDDANCAGIRDRDGTSTAKNCAFVNNTTDMDSVDTETTNQENCSTANDFADYNNGDFRVQDTDSVLYHSGTTENGSWFTTNVSTDMFGTSWDGSNPSVGAYEFAEAGGISIPVVVHHIGQMRR
jgi:hypothetical protein